MSAAKLQSLGMDSAKVASLGGYTMSLPWSGYYTGVSGYVASNKASLVIKNGWIVGEFYNQASAHTGLYALASNSKSFTMMLFGRLMLDYPALGLTPQSHLYDERWLLDGYPLTDDRKADITFEQVFRHVSGIVPEAQDPMATTDVQRQANWNFAPYTVGHDPDYPLTAPLYFDPGQPSSYTLGSTYSSVAFNHFSLLLRNVTGADGSVYLRRVMLDPIGVGKVAYTTYPGLGAYVWATASGLMTGARDYARLAYLLLHEGDWNGTQIVPATWIRRFTTVPGYPNISSNANCVWGAKYPKDMYRIVGSGINIAYIVPSLDLIGTLNGRTPNSQSTVVNQTFLKMLFAAVTQPYEACDGTIINATPSPAPPPPSTGLVLTVTGRSDATTQYAMLSWSGAKSARVDVYRNGTLRTTTANDGKQTISRAYTLPATYIFKVCEVGTYLCSNPATVSFGGGSTTTNKAPIPLFTSSCADLRCSFPDGSVDLDGTLASWKWSFGDGSTASAQNATHQYSSAGSFTVTLAVTDNRGARRSLAKLVTVTASPPANVAPDAAFTSSCTDLTCSFTDGSSDKDGNVSGWSWDFDDGSTSSSQSPSHTFAAAGSYNVKLTATDNGGAAASITHLVTVAPPPNKPPVAAFTVGCTGLDCSFTDESTDDGSVVGWSWDFGDGASATEQNPSHHFDAKGSYQVTLTATDDAGTTGTRTVTVTVSRHGSGSSSTALIYR